MNDAIYEIWRASIARKEALLAGWIAYVAMANPQSSALTREYMNAMFGPWAWRAPEMRYDEFAQTWLVVT